MSAARSPRLDSGSGRSTKCAGNSWLCCGVPRTWNHDESRTWNSFGKRMGSRRRANKIEFSLNNCDRYANATRSGQKFPRAQPTVVTEVVIFQDTQSRDSLRWSTIGFWLHC